MLDEFQWVTVAQPLYVARTGMARFQAAATGRPSSTFDDLGDVVEAARSGLDTFCQPHRVYAIGVSTADRGKSANSYGPMYLTGGYVLADWGRNDDEVLMTDDDPARLKQKVRDWVTGHRDRANARLARMPDPDAGRS